MSIYIAFVVTEKFFFDKLLYKKSPIHGYIRYERNILDHKNNLWVERRLRDLRLVYTPELKEIGGNQKILGVKTENKYNIALIGDSMTYGEGIKENETFGRILEAKLNNIRPTKVYVLAVSGDGIVENYAKFLQVKSWGTIDLYIVTMVDNDLLYDHNDRYPNEADAYQSLMAQCPGEELIPDYEDSMFKLYFVNQVIPSYSSLFTNRCYAAIAVKSMTERSDRILFFPLFSLNGFRENPLDSTLRATNQILFNYQTIVKNSGGTVLNINDLAYEYQKVSDKEGHPSAKMHHRYAQALYQEVTTNPHWGFVSGQSD